MLNSNLHDGIFNVHLKTIKNSFNVSRYMYSENFQT